MAKLKSKLRFVCVMGFGFLSPLQEAQRNLQPDYRCGGKSNSCDGRRQNLQENVSMPVLTPWLPKDLKQAGTTVGKKSPHCINSQVVDAVSIPVIAAGGIGDGRGIAAVLALGAAGAQIGSRFAATLESSAHQNFKNAILHAAPDATMLAMKT